MTDKATYLKYEAIKVVDVMPMVEGGLATIVLDTDQGRLGLHMRRAVFDLLVAELQQALEREASVSPHRKSPDNPS